jgi:hypothetical protein
MGSRAGGIHRLHKRCRLPHDQRICSPRSIEDCRAFEVIIALNIMVCGDRRLPIALEPNANDSHARTWQAASTLRFAFLTGNLKPRVVVKMPCCL